MELEKLEYINNFLNINFIKNNSSNYNLQRNDQDNTKYNLKSFNWLSLKKDTIRLINYEVNLHLKGNKHNLISIELNNLNKKLNIAHAYFNLVLLTFALRYIDIVIKVKYGGTIFTISTLLSFYYGNKYFEKFHCAQMLKELAYLNKKEYCDYLELIKLKHKKNTKEENLTQIRLNKYWKEPMSWH